MVIETRPLSEHVGVEVLGLTEGHLQRPDVAAELDALLSQHGVLVFREIHVDDAAQVAFSRHLGEVQTLPGGRGPNPEIFIVSLDPAKSQAAAYLRGTFFWHIDGATDPVPNKATMLAAKAVAADGGETEFCSTYVGYDTLPDDLKGKVDELRVIHSFEAAQWLIEPDPSEADLALWRKRPTRSQPLVWTHGDGRKSLVLGATTDCIEGFDRADSDALLQQLLHVSIEESKVYRHTWSVGDLVVWDNRGTMHRAVPYAVDSPRVMHRTTIFGDEAFN